MATPSFLLPPPLQPCPARPPEEPPPSGEAPRLASSLGEAPSLASPRASRPVPSFAEVRAAFSGRVARWIRQSGVPRKDRPDVEQVAWWKVELSLPRYNPDLPIEPWLRTLVLRTAWHYLDLAHVRRERLTRDGEVHAAVPEPAMDRRIDAEALLARIEATLPEEEWEIFRRVEVEGMPGPEVAKVLGVPEGTVASRLRRARSRIAALRDRMASADRRRTGMFVWPAFLLAWRERWAGLRAWLDRRFASGALVGGVLAYWLLHPAPASMGLAGAPADRAVASGPVSVDAAPVLAVAPPSGAKEVEVAKSPDAAERADAAERSQATARPVEVAAPAGAGQKVAAAPASRPAGPGLRAAPGLAVRPALQAAPSKADEKERAAERSALAALEAAHALLRNGHCDEAGRRLDRYADRLARGPFAPEYRELRRRVQACLR